MPNHILQAVSSNSYDNYYTLSILIFTLLSFFLYEVGKIQEFCKNYRD